MSAPRVRGPVGLLDAAVELVRALPVSFSLRAMGGLLPLSLVALVLFELDALERVQGLREIGALALSLAWWRRVHVAGRLAGVAAQKLEPSFKTRETLRATSSLRAALVLGAGLLPWAALLAAFSIAGPTGLVLGAPLLSLRGAVAPSWLARLGLHEERGGTLFSRAVRDGSHRRLAGVGAELLVLLGTFVVGVNLWVLASIGAMMARAFLGLDVALVESFVSPSNSFFLVLLALAAAAMLEPLRVALSAVHYVEGRARLEGFDVRRMVERAIGAARTVALLVAAWGVGAAALAQDAQHAQDEQYAQDGQYAQDVRLADATQNARIDANASRALSAARRILARSEYAEPAARKSSLARWFDDLWHAFAEWLRQKDEATGGNIEHLDVGLSVPTWAYFVVIALVVAVLAVVSWRRRDAFAAHDAPSPSPVAAGELERAPQAHLDDAAVLAQRGEYRAALRTLYLATLVGLERRGLLQLDPHRTNAQYLRALRGRAESDDFARFTRKFDAHWYGRMPAHHDDYVACRALAERLSAAEATA